MTMSDEIILEYLHDVNTSVNADVIYHNVVEEGSYDFSKRTVNNALKRLRDNDFVTRTHGTKGYHRITPAGREFIGS